MNQLLWISLILIQLSVTESLTKEEGCLSQPVRSMRRKAGGTVVLQCNVSSFCSGSNQIYEWFAFTENSHHRLNLSANPLKYSLYGASLQITSLSTNDSGIYHCATASAEQTAGRQHVGPGTVLRVGGPPKTAVKNILIGLSFTLLIVYSVVILTLIILKKCGSKLSPHRRTSKTNKNFSATKRRFHDVLHELTNRRHLKGGGEGGEDGQGGEESSSSPEAANGDFISSPDDIYQNV